MLFNCLLINSSASGVVVTICAACFSSALVVGCFSKAASSALYLALIALTPATVMSPDLYLSNSSFLLFSISASSAETGAIDCAAC